MISNVIIDTIDIPFCKPLYILSYKQGYGIGGREVYPLEGKFLKLRPPIEFWWIGSIGFIDSWKVLPIFSTTGGFQLSLIPLKMSGEEYSRNPTRIENFQKPSTLEKF